MSYEVYPSSLVTYHYDFRLTFALITDSACAGEGTYTEYFCENSRCRQWRLCATPESGPKRRIRKSSVPFCQFCADAWHPNSSVSLISFNSIMRTCGTWIFILVICHLFPMTDGFWCAKGVSRRFLWPVPSPRLFPHWNGRRDAWSLSPCQEETVAKWGHVKRGSARARNQIPRHPPAPGRFRQSER